MAISTTKIKDINFGNLKAQIHSIAFTSVTGGKIETGMQNVLFAAYIPSTSDDHGIVYRNSSTASETQDDFGDVYVDGVTPNDNGMLLVIGV